MPRKLSWTNFVSVNKKESMKKIILFFVLFFSLSGILSAQKLTIGGYGEVAMTRNYYSDNVYRYSSAASHKDENHGRFDIPHAVINLSYDFGKGWLMQSEIEFEHLGTGAASEKEFEEAGEWETEIEKGGEVALEQFWIQKTFLPQLNVRVGHIVVPVGGLNNAHEPLEFFTVYRPEGEYTILPSTWHDTGISIWGRAGKWRYEAMVVAGLDAFMFGRDNFIKGGAGSPFEFKVANKYGYAGRIDNYSIKGLRLGLSGFYGESMHNTYPDEMSTGKYADIKGRVLFGAFDFTYSGHNILARGNADYGTLSDAGIISNVKRNRTANNAPYDKSPVGKAAFAVGGEIGYDIAAHIAKMKSDGQKLYVFGRYECYNPYIADSSQEVAGFTRKQRIAAGVNWFPIPQIVVKAEYSHRFLRSGYNDEPSVSLGIAYMGFFTK